MPQDERGDAHHPPDGPPAASAPTPASSPRPARFVTVAYARSLALTIGVAALVGVLAGAASALFLALLDGATALREARPVLVFALPIAGLALGWWYERFGAPVAGGNNLVIAAIEGSHEAGHEAAAPRLPARMAPMVLAGTVITHLFGGSAGREGTAVQMGAGLAELAGRAVGTGPALRRALLSAGVAGGFGSVFGTPFAGAVFALELVRRGRLHTDVLVPAIVASIVGDIVTRALGITHTAYPAAPTLAFTPLVIGKWLVFAAAVAATSVGFVAVTNGCRRMFARYFGRLPVRLGAGGLVVLLLTLAFGTHAYLGLGIPTIVRAFEDPGLPAHAFAAKLIFTAVTIGAGFIGGEVTPLFFIGAALGNTLGQLLGLPLPLAAGVGMAATFAAAAKTPLALAIMAVELLGAAILPHVALVAAVATWLAGRRGIYPGQRG